MQISSKDWENYIKKLNKLNETAGLLMSEYISKHGFGDTDAIISYAYGLVTKYGEGSAALSAAMYDAIAEMSGKTLPPAEVAPTADYKEVAEAVNGTIKQSSNPKTTGSTVSRLVKQAGADTMLKNAERDGAQFAWVPSGDTCAFCLTLASNGFQYMSENAKKNGHAEHIHANCDCNYTVRFDNKSGVQSYDPKKYKEIYDNADGDINEIRRMQYRENKDRINAQKREAYAERKEKDKLLESKTLVEKTKNNEYNLGKHVHFNTQGMTEKEYADYKRDIESANKFPTVRLGKEEYKMVVSAFNQYIYNAQDTEIRKRGVVIKEVRNCKYTAVNYGFDNYRFIGKEKIK